MSAKERKRKSTKARAQKGTKERKRAFPLTNCRQPGLKQPGLGTPNNKFLHIRGPQMGGQIRRGRMWRFWGAPFFSPEVPKYLFLKGFELWTDNRGAPKTPNSTTTDPTPHLRSSDAQISAKLLKSFFWDFLCNRSLHTQLRLRTLRASANLDAVALPANEMVVLRMVGARRAFAERSTDVLG